MIWVILYNLAFAILGLLIYRVNLKARKSGEFEEINPAYRKLERKFSFKVLYPLGLALAMLIMHFNLPILKVIILLGLLVNVLWDYWVVYKASDISLSKASFCKPCDHNPNMEIVDPSNDPVPNDGGVDAFLPSGGGLSWMADTEDMGIDIMHTIDRNEKQWNPDTARAHVGRLEKRKRSSR